MAQDELADFAKAVRKAQRFFSTEATIKRIKKKQRSRRRKAVLRKLQAEERRLFNLRVARARIKAGSAVARIKRKLKGKRSIYE